MFKRKWLTASAAALFVVVVGGGAVMAQSTGDSTGTTFLDRVAQKLGIDTPKLQKAITDTRNEDVDKAVADGDLTQKQADALKQRIEDQPGFGGPFGGPHGGFKGGDKNFGFEFGFGFGPGLGASLQDAEKQMADFLGISTDQLMTEMKADDATLAKVAEAHGKSRDDVKTFITDLAKAKLDEAVKNGDLTQKHADAFQKMLTDNIDKLLDGRFGMFFRGIERHGGGPGMPKMTPKPDATPGTAPQSGAGADGVQNF